MAEYDCMSRPYTVRREGAAHGTRGARSARRRRGAGQAPARGKRDTDTHRARPAESCRRTKTRERCKEKEIRTAEQCTPQLNSQSAAHGARLSTVSEVSIFYDVSMRRNDGLHGRHGREGSVPRLRLLQLYRHALRRPRLRMRSTRGVGPLERLVAPGTCL